MNLMSESASVGIIGGADGPTAVFVSGSPLPFFLIAAGIAAAVALLVTGIVLYIKKR